ncbi:hypothetical protein FACS189490_07570 [Clostridia bacterium]|nr:hypothetical protein FACS189490_07570 [Clostridia bacterium]
MKRFDNLIIRRKLFIGFAISIVITSVLAVFAVVSLSGIKEDYKKSVTDLTAQTEIFANSLTEFMKMRMNVRELLLKDIGDAAAISETAKEIAASAKTIDNYLAEYIGYANAGEYVVKSGLSGGEAQSLKNSVAALAKNFANVAALMISSDKVSAEAAMNESVSAASAAMESFQRAFADTTARSKSVISDEDRNAAGAITGLILIYVFALIASLAVSLFISKKITNPIKKLTEDADRIAEGYLDTIIVSNRRDEVGELAKSFDSVVNVFRVIQREVDKFSKTAELDGNLDAKIDETKFKRDYRLFAGEINEAFGSFSNDIDVVADALRNYAQGNFNFSVKRFAGKKSVLNETLDALKNNLNAVKSDVLMLTAHAADGDLSQHVKAEKYEGDWRELADSLNVLTEKVSEPINEVVRVMREMANGQLNIAFEGVYKGDYKELKNSVNSTIKLIHGYMEEISSILTAMSREDLTVEITRDYLGDFIPIKDSLNLISKTFNDIITEINISAEQVAAGARLISESSMTLAAGASVQAGSVDQMTGTIETINKRTVKNADNAENANKLALSARERADAGNAEMQKMLESMSEISDATRDISKIIKVIEEIASQTNLLALNAAVEAAHAGIHGKGFTVVADQVGNLAGRSKEAARQTNVLIEGTVGKVAHGMQIANQTAEALNAMVSQIVEISGLISEVAASSVEQAEAISTVNEGILQISTVTQTNSATSEEEASSSQELSSQAEVLNSMVSRFTLRKKGGAKAAKTKAVPAVTTALAEAPAKAVVSKPTEVKPAVAAKPKTVAPKAAERKEVTPKAVVPKAVAAKAPEAKAAKPIANPITKPAVKTEPKPAVKTEPKPAPKLSHSDIPQRSGAITKASDIKPTKNTNAAFYSSYDSKDFGKY